MAAPVPASEERWEQLPGPLQRLAEIGLLGSDSEELRLRKRVLNLTPALIAAIAPIWVVTYAVLGHWLPAAIPGGYIIATVALLLARSRGVIAYEAQRFASLAMMLLLPFFLQWSLGGFANSSAVAIWGATAPLGAIFFVGARQAFPWFAAASALLVVSALIDPALSDTPPEIPEAVRVVFFCLNLLAVSATVFLLAEYFVRAREAEQARSERLLLNVLPEPVARRLKRSDGVIADAYSESTVLFADLVDFTPLAERMDATDLVRLLDQVFGRWDALAARHGLEKIKTIGDAYMVVGGVPEPRADHAEAVATMALQMGAELSECRMPDGSALRARIGIDSGPVVAGVIGRSKFIYDLWGDTVNTASRMESSGEPGMVQVTERAHGRLDGRFELRPRGTVPVKGKGPMRTYYLQG